MTRSSSISILIFATATLLAAPALAQSAGGNGGGRGGGGGGNSGSDGGGNDPASVYAVHQKVSPISIAGGPPARRKPARRIRVDYFGCSGGYDFAAENTYVGCRRP